MKYTAACLLIICALNFSSGCNRGGTMASLFESKSDDLFLTDQEEQNDQQYLALQEEDLKNTEETYAQPNLIPGDPRSGIPILEHFKRPMAELAAIFQTVYFETDEHFFRKKDYFSVIDKVADYMKKHPKLYVAIGGHTDERASEAYNLSLGTRRANYVRSMLIQKGIDPNRIFSISYGKERPVDLRRSPNGWSKNRRVEFRIHEKK